MTTVEVLDVTTTADVTITATDGTDLGSVSVNGDAVGTDGEGDGGGDRDGGFSMSNPLALWPGGLFGRVTGGLLWLVVIVYGALKSLAIYLGY